MVNALILGLAGLCFGSFANVWAARLHAGENYFKGRSRCDNCQQQLKVLDLIPVLSWLFLRGRCRYCRKPLSVQYPLVELATGLVFALSYIWWPGKVDTAADWLLLATWLASAVGLMALLVSDARWLLLPNKILYPTFLVAATGRLIYIVKYQTQPGRAIWLWLAAVAVASGFFWLIYVVSSGRWIGFGDVRLGLITGSLLAKPSLALLMIFLASIIGSLVAIPLLLSNKRHLGQKLAFGPYLIASTAIVVIFGQSILDWYLSLLS